MTGGGKGGGGKKKVQRVCDVICKRPHKKYDSTPIILYLLIFFLLRIRKLFFTAAVINGFRKQIL